MRSGSALYEFVCNMRASHCKAFQLNALLAIVDSAGDADLTNVRPGCYVALCGLDAVSIDAGRYLRLRNWLQAAQ